MQAFVVYESMFGNTRAIAHAIGAGLADAFDVAVVPVAQADATRIRDADLIVVGGPTHVHSMSRASTRKGAAKQAAGEGRGLTLEPGALQEVARDPGAVLHRDRAQARRSEAWQGRGADRVR